MQRGWGELTFAFGVYAVLLAVQIVSALIGHAGWSFEGLLLGDALLATVALVAALATRDLILPALRKLGFSLRAYGAILLASVPIYAAVAFFVYGLEVAFATKAPRLLTELGERGMALAILLACVTPPLFEELIFRGVLFGRLQRQLSRQEVYWITSVAFAILHLSVLSLPTHVALGMYFCWLRERSGSLYPAIFAHALHNGWVLADEYFRLLPGMAAG